ncbi:hypothetical protein IF1G_07100 [Cordyceps javanica]|uniref:Uncharacterized protein n=1 Tax=Cordyceps javanica TaxID=43265 RepID=A0A545UXN3_9HYPO|nr:hypothetical protein IF1G_07100 [Cordyceps javanica]
MSLPSSSLTGFCTHSVALRAAEEEKARLGIVAGVAGGAALRLARGRVVPCVIRGGEATVRGARKSKQLAIAVGAAAAVAYRLFASWTKNRAEQEPWAHRKGAIVVVLWRTSRETV